MTNAINRTITKETLDRLWEAGLLKFGMDENGDLNAIYVDAAGNQRVSQELDFVADIEVDGIELDIVVGDTSSSSDVTAVSVGANDKAKVYGVAIAGDADLTGDVILKLGSTQKSIKLRDGIKGGTHWVMPLSNNYIVGGLGDDIIIKNSVAEAISYSIYYEVVTP